MIEKFEISKANTSKVDFSKIHDSAFIDGNERLQRQPVAISIGESQYKQNHYPIPFGSYGDFSSIVGASKSRKTFVKSILEAAYLGGNSINYFENIKGHDTENKYVISIDTEQSKYHTQRSQQRVIQMVGAYSKNYITLSLREGETEHNLDFIEWLFMESQYKGKIGLMCIDGVADLLDNVNDLDASNKVVKKLMKWSTIGNTHITAVIHRNHGSAKPTGHLGSAILKKSETVAFVEKDGDLTKVNCEYSRNIAFEPFKFSIDSDWLPIESDEIF